MHGAFFVKRGQRVEIGGCLEAPEVFAMKCTALRSINKRAFVVYAENPGNGLITAADKTLSKD